MDVIMRAMDIASVGKAGSGMDVATTSLVIPDEYGSADFSHLEERINNGYTKTEGARQMLDDFFDPNPVTGYLKRRRLKKLERGSSVSAISDKIE
ncbi:MAG: hypothetical protein LBR47_07860, partial [Spirochaetaceae bacterium]|jgi:hypothetical protein|nr:hypothetical protein [Spirochaetaceae bacterium]